MAGEERPKVVLYIDNAGGFGGSMRSLKNTLLGLDACRFRPVLVAGHQSGEPSAAAETYRVPYKPYYRFMPSVWDRINRSCLPVFVRKVLNAVRFGLFLVGNESRYFFKLWKIALAHNPSLIHLNNNVNSQLSGIFLARMLRIPCVSHQRDFENRSWFVRLVGQFVDHHIGISESVRENLVSIGIGREKISVIPDAVDVTLWKPDSKDENLPSEFGVENGYRLVGIFGRVVPWKGQHVFVQAMKEVCGIFPDVRGFVVGDQSDGCDSYFEQIAKEIDQLGLQGRILLTGYRKDVKSLMAMMDIVVHASTRPEPFGMVIIEAMSLGKPVVATEGGGPSEIITNGESGILVPRGDSRSLAHAIRELLENPGHAKDLGAEGRRLVEERFSHTQQAGAIVRIYSDLLKDRQQIQQIVSPAGPLRGSQTRFEGNESRHS